MKAIGRELLEVADQRVEVKERIEAADAHVDDMYALLANAHQRLTEAETELARFLELATTAGSPILGPNKLTAQQLADFVRASGQTPNITVTIDELAQLYIEESEKVGVRGDVAWAQSILETGFFGFEGSMVEPEDNNFAGIGACDSCTRGYRFADARLGVRAQMQLLRVYVDAKVTETSLPDPLLLPRHAAARLPRQGPVVVGSHGHVGDRARLRHPRLRPLPADRHRARARAAGRTTGARAVAPRRRVDAVRLRNRTAQRRGQVAATGDRDAVEAEPGTERVELGRGRAGHVCAAHGGFGVGRANEQAR